MKSSHLLRRLLLPVAILGAVSCDMTDSNASDARKEPVFTTLAPRIVAAQGGSPEEAAYVRLRVAVVGSSIVKDTIYPYKERRGRVRGIPVGATVEIGVVGFDSVVGGDGKPAVVNRWAGARNAVVQAVAANLDSAAVASTQPKVEVKAPATVKIDLSGVATKVASGESIVLPTASEMKLNSAQEYRYVVDNGSDLRPRTVDAGSSKVPADGKLAIHSTSWVKVRLFVSDSATRYVLGTKGDSILVHVDAPAPESLKVESGDARATVSWVPGTLGRVKILYRSAGDSVWRSQEVAASKGEGVLTGLANGQEWQVRSLTIWGPQNALDHSDTTPMVSVVPMASVPTTLVPGTWHSFVRDQDTVIAGQYFRGVWTLESNGDFKLDYRRWEADWKNKKWIQTSWWDPKDETLKPSRTQTGKWRIAGDSMILSDLVCSPDFSYSPCSSWYAIRFVSLGDGAFRILNHNGWQERMAMTKSPDPQWDYPEDATAPTLDVQVDGAESIRGDSIFALSGSSITVRYTARDALSGLDSIHTQTSSYASGFPARSYSMSWVHWVNTATTTDWIRVRDQVGNVTTRTLVFVPRQKDPDWIRSTPGADTVRVKSGSVTFSGKVSSRFRQVYLDTIKLSPDATGNISRFITPTAFLTRRILRGIDDSGRTTYLDTLWVALDATPPNVVWVAPANGVDTTLAAGTTTRSVSVTVTDAGSGVASVMIGSTPLSRQAGDAWIGTISGLKSGENAFTLTATDGVGNSSTSPLVLKVKTNLALRYDTLKMGSERASLGSFLSVRSGKVLTSTQANLVDPVTGAENWTLVDLVFRTDSTMGADSAKRFLTGRIFSPASTLKNVSNPNASKFVKLSGAAPADKAALATAYASGVPVDHVAISPSDKFVVKTSLGEYALIVIGPVNYTTAYNGIATVFLSR